MNNVTFFFGGWEPVLRILIVGTAAYVALVVILRATGTRTLAQMNAFDFIVTVALGASFGRILTARNVALVEAITAFLLLAALQFVVTWLKVRSPAFARAITTAPVMLYYKGEFQHQSMRRVRVTEVELNATVRLKGAGSLNEVDAIVLESNGQFAVIKSNSVGDGAALPLDEL